jgi:hypothetical protein
MHLNTRHFEFLSKFLISCTEGLQSRKSTCKETGCTSYGNQVAVATKFFKVAHSTCGFSVRFLLPSDSLSFEVDPRFLKTDALQQLFRGSVS